MHVFHNKKCIVKHVFYFIFHQDAFPSKSINIEEATAEPADKTKPFSFGFKTKDGKVWAFASENDAG